MGIVDGLLGFAFGMLWLMIKASFALALHLFIGILRLGEFLYREGRNFILHRRDERSRTREWRIRLPYHQLRDGFEPALMQAARFIGAQGSPNRIVRLTIAATSPAKREWTSSCAVAETFDQLRHLLMECLSDLSRQIAPGREVRLVLWVYVDPAPVSELF